MFVILPLVYLSHLLPTISSMKQAIQSTVWIDGDAMQLWRMEYGRCQMYVVLHGVHPWTNGIFTTPVFFLLALNSATHSICLIMRLLAQIHSFFDRLRFKSCLVDFILRWVTTRPLSEAVGSSSLWDTEYTVMLELLILVITPQDATCNLKDPHNII